jgi:hypothetical protein
MKLEQVGTEQYVRSEVLNSSSFSSSFAERSLGSFNLESLTSLNCMWCPQHFGGNGPPLNDERMSNSMQVEQKQCPQLACHNSAPSSATGSAHATQ